MNDSIYADADFSKGKDKGEYPYASVTYKSTWFYCIFEKFLIFFIFSDGQVANGSHPYEHIKREAVPNIYATPNEQQRQPFSAVEKDLQAMQGYKAWVAVSSFIFDYFLNFFLWDLFVIRFYFVRRFQIFFNNTE